MRPPASGEERIGWSGDFYTSSDVHPLLAKALVKQAQQIDSLLGRPDPFTVMEMGPGKGLFAKQFLSVSQSESGMFDKRLRYLLVERSPAMRDIQRINLQTWCRKAGPVVWVEDMKTVAPASVSGLLFSNELADAFPVHRIQVTEGKIEEFYVDCTGTGFIECRRPVTFPPLLRHLERLNLSLPDGYRTEVNLNALQWMEEVARAINRGVAITIDYGHVAQDLYGPERTKGTFLCYHGHLASDDPYVRIGHQDMTAHVDFSSLATVGEEQGLHVTGFTNQLSFLMGLGVDEILAELEPDSPEFRAAIHLLRPDGMGSTFKVLVQHKGLKRPELDGLKFKPFFGEALGANTANGQQSFVNRESTSPRQ
jgi:SAM-dependent MidA family methyltransferase